jgi:hypothetical protein
VYYELYQFHFDPEALRSVAEGRLVMSFPYTPNLKDAKVESLRTQQDYLNLLRLRHLQWMSAAEDSETEQKHQEIAELIEQVTDHYNRLFAGLEQSQL